MLIFHLHPDGQWSGSNGSSLRAMQTAARRLWTRCIRRLLLRPGFRSHVCQQRLSVRLQMIATSRGSGRRPSQLQGQKRGHAAQLANSPLQAFRAHYSHLTATALRSQTFRETAFCYSNLGVATYVLPKSPGFMKPKTAPILVSTRQNGGGNCFWQEQSTPTLTRSASEGDRITDHRIQNRCHWERPPSFALLRFGLVCLCQHLWAHQPRSDSWNEASAPIKVMVLSATTDLRNSCVCWPVIW